MKQQLIGNNLFFKQIENEGAGLTARQDKSFRPLLSLTRILVGNEVEDCISFYSKDGGVMKYRFHGGGKNQHVVPISSGGKIDFTEETFRVLSAWGERVLQKSVPR